MNSKIFRSTFFTSMFVLIVSFIMVFNVLYNYFEAQVFSELESEAGYISYAISKNDSSFFENFKTDNKRITLISPNGEVLADSETDAEKLENHSNRKEIIDAKTSGSGKSSRYSETLTEKTLYYAKKLENGNILRISTTQHSILVILLGIMQPTLAICAIALVISIFLSLKISNSIIKPINNLDLENPENNVTYEELNPLLKKLETQKKTIAKQIKDAKKSREEFNLICENMNEGFLVIDINEKILSYNSAALNLLDIKSAEGENILKINRAKNFHETIENSLKGIRAENTLSMGDRTYTIISNPVYGNKKIIGAVIVIIDITESAKREQIRREFTSNVSHELKTPLTSISGFAEMMAKGDIPKETVMDFSKSIYEEAQRLIGLVCDIMKISELDEGNIEYDKEEINLLSLSKDALKRLLPIAEKNNISISVSGDDAYVFGTKKILDEMIYNLCDNAVKYNKSGGSVNISISASNGEAKLTVSDTGIGIPKGEQQRVFERFYRVEKSRVKTTGGTGLGLSIVKHGAIFHNAKTELKSEEGIGTSISIIFPSSR